jgi:hypothetical protein
MKSKMRKAKRFLRRVGQVVRYKGAAWKLWLIK